MSKNIYSCFAAWMKRLLRILRIWVTPVHEMLNNEKSNFTCTRTAVNYWFYQALAGISLTLEQYVWSAVCTYELKSKPAHKGPPDFQIHRIIINVNLLFICLSVKFYIFRQGSYRTIHWNTPSFFKKEGIYENTESLICFGSERFPPKWSALFLN